jgi:hypothetical protein
MIDLAALTVRDMLPRDLRKIDKEVAERLDDAAERGMGRVPRALSGPIAERINTEVLRTLDIRLLPIIANAWSKATEIRRYRSTEAEADGHQSTTLFLGEHDLTATLHPRVTVEFSGAEAFEIPFDLTIGADLKIAQLTIRAGHIVEVGRCEGAMHAQLACGGLPLHDELRSEYYPLSESWVLPPPGIRI